MVGVLRENMVLSHLTMVDTIGVEDVFGILDGW